MQSAHTKADTRAKDTVDHLNSFLRGELAAVETYRLALQKVEDFRERDVLEDCSRSHQQRVRSLTTEVQRRGGEPAKESGPWGTFAKVVEGGARVLGHKIAVAALEQGEDHGRDDYRHGLNDLDVQARSFVQSEVLPEQIRTHDAISTLKRTMV